MTDNFDSRKQDHIRLALDQRTQAVGQSGLEKIRLIHEALPDLDLEDVNLETDYWGTSLAVPLFISSMTAGHQQGVLINSRLAHAAAERGWAMGVGSQRRELSDPEAGLEWRNLRKQIPSGVLFGNLGLVQVIKSPIDAIEKLVDSLQASALFIHLNPLQEGLQPEGQPQFRGGEAKIAELVRKLAVPIILKEVGCGISAQSLKRWSNLGLAAVDVAGLGGTHWGRLEGYRSDPQHIKAQAARTFADWGISTLESLLEAGTLHLPFQLWGSGGVRTGLDAAKLIALGASKVGLAQPMLQAALESEQNLRDQMQQIEFELKLALFCTGCKSPEELRARRLFRWN